MMDLVYIVVRRLYVLLIGLGRCIDILLLHLNSLVTRES